MKKDYRYYTRLLDAEPAPSWASVEVLVQRAPLQPRTRWWRRLAIFGTSVGIAISMFIASDAHNESGNVPSVHSFHGAAVTEAGGALSLASRPVTTLSDREAHATHPPLAVIHTSTVNEKNELSNFAADPPSTEDAEVTVLSVDAATPISYQAATPEYESALPIATDYYTPPPPITLEFGISQGTVDYITHMSFTVGILEGVQVGPTVGYVASRPVHILGDLYFHDTTFVRDGQTYTSKIGRRNTIPRTRIALLAGATVRIQLEEILSGVRPEIEFFAGANGMSFESRSAVGASWQLVERLAIAGLLSLDYRVGKPLSVAPVAHLRVCW